MMEPEDRKSVSKPICRRGNRALEKATVGRRCGPASADGEVPRRRAAAWVSALLWEFRRSLDALPTSRLLVWRGAVDDVPRALRPWPFVPAPPRCWAFEQVWVLEFPPPVKPIFRPLRQVESRNRSAVGSSCPERSGLRGPVGFYKFAFRFSGLLCSEETSLRP
jgi:hypothetical protein